MVCHHWCSYCDAISLFSNSLLISVRTFGEIAWTRTSLESKTRSVGWQWWQRDSLLLGTVRDTLPQCFGLTPCWSAFHTYSCTVINFQGWKFSWMANEHKISTPWNYLPHSTYIHIHCSYVPTVLMVKATYSSISVDAILKFSPHQTEPWNKILMRWDFEEIR